jgi:hypothetical protein
MSLLPKLPSERMVGRPGFSARRHTFTPPIALRVGETITPTRRQAPAANNFRAWTPADSSPTNKIFVEPSPARSASAERGLPGFNS